MPKRKFSAIGDSLTDLFAGWARPSETWVPRLEKILRSRGLDVGGEGWGYSGQDTVGILSRGDVPFMFGTPDLHFIYAGVNNATSTTVQAGIQALIKSAKFGALGASVAGPGYGAAVGGGVTVADQTALPSTGSPGQRYVVLADTDPAGGASADSSLVAAGKQMATIAGAGGGAQTVWEYRYQLAGPYGWGRVAGDGDAPTACQRIVVVSIPYWNLTSGGDSLNTPQATNAAKRAAQQAAVAAENKTVGGVPSVVYADLYGFQRARIVAGTDPDFSTVAYDATRSWHASATNLHFNSYGHALVAQCLSGALPAAWLSALS